MKRNIIFIFSIIIILIAIFFYWYTNTMKEKRITKNYNSEYEIYSNAELDGLEITTIINKAINNNEKYSIEKDKKKLYINDNKNSIKVFVKVKKDSDFYPMEAFYEAGINEFTKAYGQAKFKCTSIEYHENNKISKIFFEIQE